MAQNIPNEKCDFINTEINHDLGPSSGGPVKIDSIHKKTDFVDSSRIDTPCNLPIVGSNWFKDDPGSFKYVVGYEPSQLYDRDFKPTSNDGILITCVVKTELGNQNVKIRKYHQDHGSYTDFKDKNLFHMFDDCEGNPNSNGSVDAFFVIDTGDKLGHLLGDNDRTKQKSTGGLSPLSFQHYTINVVHSTVTMGDSAGKNWPHSPKFDKIFNKYNGKPNVIGFDERVPCDLCSWLVTKNIMVGNLSEGAQIPKQDFMSDYTINANYMITKPYSYQNWTHPTIPQMNYNTTNPKKENNKPSVQNWLRTSANLDIIESNVADAPGSISQENKRNISLNVQKKRSGDHLQILFAKYLYKFKNDLNIQKPDNYPSKEEKRQLFATKTDDYYKKNTFFITGDWPACAFAIYNKINTVMFYKQKDKTQSCFLVFTF